MDKPLNQSEARVFGNHARVTLHFLASGGYLAFWRKTPDEVVSYLAQYGIQMDALKVCGIIGRKT